MFAHLLSFCQQNIAKSDGHFSKMNRDLSEHRQGCVIQIIHLPAHMDFGIKAVDVLQYFFLARKT